MAAGGDAQRDLEEACRAVRLAASLCQKVQQQLKDGEAAAKGDASPVTIADYGAQALVAWSLQRSFGSAGFQMVAEEDSEDLRVEGGQAMAARIAEVVNQTLAEAGQGEQLSEADVLALIDSGTSPGGSQGRHWVLDPIDGTRGFVGQRQYAVCLGLIQDGRVVAGVLGCPNLPQAPLTDADGEAGAAARSQQAGVGCLFAGRAGAGAFVGPLFGEELPAQRLRLEDSADIASARFMESYESGHSDQGFTQALAAELGVTRPPLRLDSQAKYGALARGDAAINLRFPRAGYREKIWDHAAGALIVREAGARITDVAGAELDFSRGRWLDLERGIVTATPAVHAALLAAIQRLDAKAAG